MWVRKQSSCKYTNSMVFFSQPLDAPYLQFLVTSYWTCNFRHFEFWGFWNFKSPRIGRHRTYYYFRCPETAISSSHREPKLQVRRQRRCPIAGCLRHLNLSTIFLAGVLPSPLSIHVTTIVEAQPSLNRYQQPYCCF